MLLRLICLIVFLIGAPDQSFSIGWERTSGPGGGVVNAIETYNISSFPYIFAGTRVAGIFRTDSNGDQWSASGVGVGAATMTCFHVSEDLVFAGGHCGGVYRSLDSGRTWQESNFDGVPCMDVFDIARTASFVFALTNFGVYRSENDGLGWIRVDSNLVNDPRCIVVDPLNSSILYVADFGMGVYRSIDNGLTWQERSTGLGDYGVAALTFFGTTLVAGTSSHGVYRSTNGGLTWQAWDFGLPLPFDGSISSLAATSSQVFAGTSGRRVFVQSIGVNGWLQCSDTLPARVTTVCAKGSQLLAGTHGGGIFRVDVPTDHISPFPAWTKINVGLAGDFTVKLHEVGIHFSNYHKLLAGSYFDGVFQSTDSGSSWIQPGPDLFGVEISAVGSRAATLFAAAWDVGLYRSTSGAISWELVDSIDFVTDICVNEPNIIVCDVLGKLIVSGDNGSSWVSGTSGLPSSDGLFDLAVSGSSTYVGTSGHGLYKSTNGGMSWTSLKSPPGISQVISIAIDNLDIYFATWSAVYRTSNEGMTWSRSDSGIEGVINGLFRSTNGIFAFTNLGIFVTLNHGANWTRVNEGLEYTDVYAMAEFSGSVYAAVYESGVWKRRLSEMSYVPGDADGNLMFTISDAVYLINYVFSGGAAPDPVLAGDADCSSMVTISDAVYLISYIFSGGPQPGSACK